MPDTQAVLERVEQRIRVLEEQVKRLAPRAFAPRPYGYCTGCLRPLRAIEINSRFGLCDDCRE